MRKDVECAFDLLNKRFTITLRILDLIMRICIILYNMIIDDERDDDYDDNYHSVTSVVALPDNYETPTSLTTILQKEAHLTSVLMFLNIQFDCPTSLL
jgi:hypothetical protein